MYLGIEIGGTKLQLGLGRGDGALVGLWRGFVQREAGGEGIRQQIITALPQLLIQAHVERPQLRGIGIGFGGPVDDAARSVIKSHQIAGWDNFPLADWIEDMLGLPTVLGNDADVAGLAEALFGAGKGLSPIFYITIGSGIGGGLINNGQIYRGCGRGAAEVGHLRVWANVNAEIMDAVPLETVASGWAIQEKAREFALRNADRDLLIVKLAGGDPRAITVQHLGQAAQLGDTIPYRLLDLPLDYLADALCHVIALLCPRRIVIGGGVSLLGEELLFRPLRRLVSQRVFAPFADCYEIEPAALGEEVVVHGALALARQHIT